MADQAWPEAAVAEVEGILGFHVRIAMRAHTIAVLTEMIYEVRRDPGTGRDGVAQLLEAKIVQLRELNRIEKLQLKEATP